MGFDNLWFVCWVYGVFYEVVLFFVEDFIELGVYLWELVKKYLSGMFVWFVFVMLMVIEFDCFLIDEVIVVGDVSFCDKCYWELFEKCCDWVMIMVLYDFYIICEYCMCVCVFEKGVLCEFLDVDLVFDFYYEIMG